jgi:hypothetical protein
MIADVRPWHQNDFVLVSTNDETRLRQRKQLQSVIVIQELVLMD